MVQSVEFELDKVRNIRFGHKQIKKAEKLTGKKFTKLMSEEEGIGTEDIEKLLFAGLSHEDKELTLDKVTDLLDEYTSPGIAIAKLGDAMNEAFQTEQSEQATKNK